MKITFRGYWIILIIFLSLMSSACAQGGLASSSGDGTVGDGNASGGSGTFDLDVTIDAFGGGCPEGPPCPDFKSCIRKIPEGLSPENRRKSIIKCEQLP